MKKYAAALISIAMVFETLPLRAVFAAEPVNLITNGSFESYDSKSEFPDGWSSEGEDLLLGGDFEAGSAALSNVGQSPSGNTLRWASPNTGANDVTLVSSETGEKAEHGSYYARLRFKASNWGGVGYPNVARPAYLLNTAYGGSYIFRADYKVSSAAAFNKAKMAAFYQLTMADSEVNNKTKFEPKFVDSETLPSTSWQSFGEVITIPDKPSGDESYYDIPRVLRLQFRYDDKPVLASGETADLFVDNIRMEKLGRTTAETAYDGSRSLKYVGYDDGLSEDWKSDEIRLAAGVEYELTYYSLGEGAHAYIEGKEGKKPDLDTIGTETDRGWTKTTVRFVADGNARVGLTGGLNTVYFDNISLREVAKPASVKISAEGGRLYAVAGAQTGLTATVYDRSGVQMDGESVLWSISETDAAAQITADGILHVNSDAALGQYITVVAALAGNEDVRDEIRLLICGVESMPVTVVISGKQSIATMTDGAYTRETYTAQVYDQYEELITEEVEFAWMVDEAESTVENITIDNNGVVTVGSNPKAGRMVIKASAACAGVTAVSPKFEINVSQSVEGIAFEQGGISVEQGGERSVAVIFRPENAENKNFTVKSSDNSIFEARAEGGSVIVKSVSAGQATITVTAEDGGFEADLTAASAKSITDSLDVTFENDGTGWNVNKVNVIPNGDFETRSGWSSVGSSSGKADSGYITASEDADKVYEGGASAYIRYGAGVLSNQWSAFRDSGVYAINPESTYRLAMAVNIPNLESGQRAALSFKITDSNNGQIVAEDPDILRITAPTSEWEVKETEYTIPQNGSKISLFAARSYAKYGFSAYFDNLTFETIAGVTSDEKYGGSHAMRIGAYEGVHSEACETVVSDKVKIEGGSAYSVSAMVKSSSTGAQGAIGIDYTDAQGNIIKTESTSLQSYADWTSVSVSGSAPQGSEYIRIKLLSSGTGMNYFDDVSLVEEIVYPDGVAVEGPDRIAIPASGEKTRSYQVQVLDQYGGVISGQTASAELKSAVAGVTVQNNVLTVSSDANPGDITLVAKFGNFSKEKTVSLIRVTSFEFKDLPESIERDSTDKTYTLKMLLGLSSVKSEIDSSLVEFSLADDYEGISIIEGGKLVISSTAKLGTIKIKAVLQDDTDIKAEFGITVKKSNTGSSGSGGGTSGGSTGGAGNTGINHINGSLGMPGYIETPTGGVKLQPGTVIRDVDESHWAYAAITAFAKNGIVSGRGDGSFDPNGIVTRSEFLKILVSVFEMELSYELVNFTDTVETQWYYPYISTAFANNIAFGYPDGSFGINMPVTREEMAVFTERALQSNGRSIEGAQASAAGFADADAISDFAQDAVELMRQAGILSGDENGMFNPKNNATRAEAVLMLYRVYSIIK